MDFVHYSVMKNEIISFLKPEKKGELFIDCTAGEGGHSEALLSAYPDIELICVDADSSILERAEKRLERFGKRVRFCNRWFDAFFSDYPYGDERPDKIFFDLGISSYHYEKSGRGFSFAKEEPLDMRLGDDLKISAADIINRYPAERLADILYKYGEERYSRKIAKAIEKARQEGEISTSARLAEIIYSSVPERYRHGKTGPATRSFMALRIAVNSELERLEKALGKALDILNPGGKMAVITFHSLEDRIVKHFFRERSKNCICPPGSPICRCGGNNKVVEILTKKPIYPADNEIEENPPSRSSKLRIAKKVNV